MKHFESLTPHHKQAETNYNKLTPILNQAYGSTLAQEEIQKLIDEAQTYERINDDESKIIGLFHYNNFKLSYLSQNATQRFECPIKDGNLVNSKALFYGLDKSHSDFPLQAFQWIKSFTNDFNAKGAALENSVNYYCGVKFLDKNNEVKSYFIRQQIRTHFDTCLPRTCLFFLTDISHLYKADFYWTRMIRGKHKEITSFRTSNQKREYKDIITPRERQVLQLISAKKESKEISKILNISPNTVDSHRKAMIKRSGTQNTTALVQLCKMIGVI